MGSLSPTRPSLLSVPFQLWGKKKNPTRRKGVFQASDWVTEATPLLPRAIPRELWPLSTQCREAAPVSAARGHCSRLCTQSQTPSPDSHPSATERLCPQWISHRQLFLSWLFSPGVPAAGNLCRQQRSGATALGHAEGSSDNCPGQRPKVKGERS